MLPTPINKKKFAVIIPVYNHKQKVAEVIEKCLRLGLPVFVVDDGSTDGTYEKMKLLKSITLLRHPVNRGKGAAILTGFHAAAKAAAWAITMDADGQHNPQDALKMMQAIPANRRPIVVGRRMAMGAENVPWTSRFGRQFSNFWVALSGGPRLHDSQSGFRIYPLPEAAALKVAARRFQFEVEILVKAHWQKIPVVEVPVGVNYAPAGERISHFRPLVDFWRNTRTFARLITGRILIRPFRRNR